MTKTTMNAKMNHLAMSHAATANDPIPKAVPTAWAMGPEITRATNDTAPRAKMMAVSRYI